MKTIILVFLYISIASTVFAQSTCLPYSTNQILSLNGSSFNSISTVITDPTQSFLLFSGNYGTAPSWPLNTINTNGFSSFYPYTGSAIFGPVQKGFLNVATSNDLQELLPSVFTLNSTGGSSLTSMALGSNYDLYFSGISSAGVNTDLLWNTASAFTTPGYGAQFISRYSGVTNYVTTLTITSIPQLFLPTNVIKISEMRVAPNGNLYVIGLLQTGIFFFDPIGNLLPPVTTTTAFAGFVAVYDTNMHIVGFYKFEKTSATFESLALDIDVNGNAVVAGTVTGLSANLQVKDANNTVQASEASTSNDGFILRLSPTLTIDEFKVVGGPGNDGILDVTYSGSGIIDVAGYFSSTVDFDVTSNSYNLVSAGGQDAFVAQYDTSTGPLALQWANALGNAGNDVAQRLDFTVTGDIMIAGQYFPTGSTVVDVFLAKYDFLGGSKLFQGVGLNDNASVKEILALNSGKVVVSLERSQLAGAPYFTALVLLDDNCP